MKFQNRAAELEELEELARVGGLLVVFGRRRVGKTRLLTHWLSGREGLYSQAIEAAPATQLGQVFADIRHGFESSLEPRSWSDLFALVDMHPRPIVLCLDEFPYLVAADPSLPSVLQRWLDHRKRKKTSLVLAGSSTRMMNDTFLHRAAPLYGRARKIVRIEPMNYGAFCRGCRLSPTKPESFVCFSLVGGVPRYWEFVSPKQSSLELAEALFFGSSPFLEFEPARLFKDEAITGLMAPAVLEAIGRGASKPSEIAGRLGVPQTSLSRAFQALLDASLLVRELPFGESVRTTKRVVYAIHDPMLRFWYRVYSPHRTRWSTYTRQEKEKLIRDHASTIFESELRRSWPSAARYWDASIELDVVREEGGQVVIGEIKWGRLTAAEKSAALARLRNRVEQGRLVFAKDARFEVLDQASLLRLA